MSISNQFINYVKFDEEKRIIIAAKPQFETYLQDEKTRQMIKKAASDFLKDDFVKLEVGKFMCRVTVKEGTEEKSKQTIEKELVNGLELALKFMGGKF